MIKTIKILISLLVLSTALCVFAEAQGIDSIYYGVIYDPLENIGILEIEVSINAENITWIYIPLQILGEESLFEYVGYNYTGGLNPLGVNYNAAQGLVEIHVQGEGKLYLLFNVNSLLEETGISAYVLHIDTTELSYLTSEVTVNVTLMGVFEQDATRIRGELEITTFRGANTTQILIRGVGELISTLYMQLEETAGPQPLQQTPWMNMLLLTLIAIVATASATAYYYFNRRRTSIVVERIDYMKDQASILILKALRESGGRGLTQAEISKVTRLPKSSVSRRIRRLEEEGFVEVKRVGKYNYVFLTNKGLELAKRVFGVER